MASPIERRCYNGNATNLCTLCLLLTFGKSIVLLLPIVVLYRVINSLVANVMHSEQLLAGPLVCLGDPWCKGSHQLLAFKFGFFTSWQSSGKSIMHVEHTVSARPRTTCKSKLFSNFFLFSILSAYIFY